MRKRLDFSEIATAAACCFIEFCIEKHIKDFNYWYRTKEDNWQHSLGIDSHRSGDFSVWYAGERLWGFDIEVPVRVGRLVMDTSMYPKDFRDILSILYR